MDYIMLVINWGIEQPLYLYKVETIFASKYSIFGACPQDMVTYIVIIYQNYDIPNLGE